MYEEPNNDALRAMQEASPFLEERTSWVHHRLFGGRSGCKEKIQRAFLVVDAIWTPEERDTIIHHRISNGDAITLLKKLDKRIIRIVHLLKHPMPMKLAPSSASTK